jgi:hypothetical protein
MKDEIKRMRKLLRPGYSYEMNGKGVKKINRKICRSRLKNSDRRNFTNEL